MFSSTKQDSDFPRGDEAVNMVAVSRCIATVLPVTLHEHGPMSTAVGPIVTLP